MDRVPSARKKAGVIIVVVVGALIVIGGGGMLARTFWARSGNPVVRIDTSMGTITAELRRDKAPVTVDNFMGYLELGRYDGTIFHRVIKGFVIQGGSFTPDFESPPTGPPIRNESRTDLRNRRGTLAMARTSDPHSATAGFYINLADNESLNRDPTQRRFGYAVFGAVIDGMDVVDRIGEVPTGSGGPFRQDLPVEPVIIESIRQVR